MTPIVLGILAHVDAGKTTLSEALLYTAGTIRRMGRVDNRDAFLDTYALERARGITIFSKQARLNWGDMAVTLLDTPGHVDFSAEMERTLQVLDYAVLVVSGADGVQGHTRTLWRLLSQYGIPVFLFVNKMDQAGTDRRAILEELKKRLDEGCIDFNQAGTEEFLENVAVCEEGALEEFLETGNLEDEKIRSLIREGKVFPCYFGSALKLEGVEALLEGIRRYGTIPCRPSAFGAKVYKIARDGQDRLTYLKVTGGSLRVKSLLSNREILNGREEGGSWEEKVNQIRLYSGDKYETVPEAGAGWICAVTGLSRTYPGQGLGFEAESEKPVLEPVFTYRLHLPEGCDPAGFLPKLRQLEEEEPALSVEWEDQLREIHVRLMGEVQTEILKSLIAERFGIAVEFGEGSIVYKETIADEVEGVGHFEPLRHYAEVHLLLEPGERGSGLQVFTKCSEDMLERNWQRLVLTHLGEKIHRGVLIGAPVTDMKITLVAGRSHNKHTEGGDFRQATYRALRQGLRQAKSLLLEPWYEFRLEVPENMIGRAMSDMEQRGGAFTIQPPQGELAVLTGSAPVSSMRGYQMEVIAYTKGHGRCFCALKGYEPCHNQEEVIAGAGYDPDRDTENPSDSVFCAHGAGFTVPWNRVREYMHVDSGILTEPGAEESIETRRAALSQSSLSTEEVDSILERTFYANKRDKSASRYGFPGKSRRREPAPQVTRGYRKTERKEEYLLIDGYNIIFAWDDLKELAEANLDAARGRLADLLCNYQALLSCHVILVFDAYRIQGHVEETVDYHNIHIVYTREAETADRYIERFAHDNEGKYQVTVATSDGLEQIIIRSYGCRLISARDLREDMERENQMLRQDYLDRPASGKNRLLDGVSGEVARQIEELFENGKE